MVTMAESTLRKINAVPSKACNCRRPAHCPMDGNFLKSSVVYQTTVTVEDNRPAETYVGLTENSFKTRYANHKSSFSQTRDSVQNLGDMKSGILKTLRCNYI